MILFHGVPLDCINHAAVAFHVPATMIVSVMKIENGRNGMAIKNKNGTYDLGVMQINTSWLPRLEKSGINQHELQFNGCTNVMVGSWILAQGIASGEGWKGLGNYHSRTPKHNATYREKVKSVYNAIMKTLHTEVA